MLFYFYWKKCIKKSLDFEISNKFCLIKESPCIQSKIHSSEF